SIRWVFRSTFETAPSGHTINGFWERTIEAALRRNGSTSWIDQTTRVVEGRVLLTPFGSEHLWCLDAETGETLWKAPRGDGLYVGGVPDGRVIVVRRDQVRCQALADGAPAWEAPASFPLGAQPCGVGCFEAEHYLVPLNSAEVIAVRIRDGRISARSRLSEGGE